MGLLIRRGPPAIPPARRPDRGSRRPARARRHSCRRARRPPRPRSIVRVGKRAAAIPAPPKRSRREALPEREVVESEPSTLRGRWSRPGYRRFPRGAEYFRSETSGAIATWQRATRANEAPEKSPEASFAGRRWEVRPLLARQLALDALGVVEV